MPTPLYDALRGYAAKAPLRFHMPGHKGAFLPCPELAPLARLDVTEIPSTGNLYEDLSPIREAQALWARRMGAEYCQFLTGGSTMGIHTALTLCCPPGSRVLVDRSCHRSTFHALALLDLDPIFLPRPWLAEEGVAGQMCIRDRGLGNHRAQHRLADGQSVLLLHRGQFGKFFRVRPQDVEFRQAALDVDHIVLRGEYHHVIRHLPDDLAKQPGGEDQ